MCLHACMPAWAVLHLNSLPCPAVLAPAAIKVTALGLPTLLERASNSLIAIRDLFRRFDTGGWEGSTLGGQHAAGTQPGSLMRCLFIECCCTVLLSGPCHSKPHVRPENPCPASLHAPPQNMQADGNGYLTQEEFAQVYSQLFVDDKPERIDEVGEYV
jgi:hypothetical protein